MRFFVLILFIPFGVFGQSIFNYGQNKEVYFFSLEEQEELGYHTFFEILKLANNETGGMHNNWSMMIYSFNESGYAAEWAPRYFSKEMEFYKDSIFDYTEQDILNGTYYTIENNRITSYGGGGYGSFDYYEYEKINDSINLVSRYCVGHCNQEINPICYSKNIYKNGKLQMYINYNICDTIFYYEEDIEDIELNLDKMNSLDSIMKISQTSDTVFYYYDKKGLFINSNNIKDYFYKEIRAQYGRGAFDYYNCFINQSEMETSIKKDIGYLPKLLLFEIFDKGVVIFYFNENIGKYVSYGELVLD